MKSPGLAQSNAVTTHSTEDSATAHASSLPVRLFFSFLLLLSGFCGISYEILYGRMLGNIVGDQFAVSASILLTFLLGIGVGAIYAHRLWPFLWLIEASIGVYGLAFSFGLETLDNWLLAMSKEI